MDNPIRPKRDRLDIASGHDHGKYHFAHFGDLGGRGEHFQLETVGMGARTLAARISGNRVSGSEQMPRHLAAHVAETDKSELHGFHLVLTEKVNITLLGKGVDIEN
jgi:hypothetical protein